MQRCEVEVGAMKSSRWSHVVCGLTALCLTPIAAWAQAPAAPLSQTPVGPTPTGSGPPVVAFLALVVLLAVIVGVVKFFDFKRKRDDEAMILEARISDALLVHPTLTGLPVHAVAHIPLAHQSEPVIEIKGTVPTPVLREEALDTVRREIHRHVPAARIEDRITVDALMLKRVA
jgi:hypothetical protein